MATLPSETWLIQQIDNEVILFHRHTEEEIVRFKPSDADACAKAQLVIHQADALSEEDACFAHFWSGYFHGCAS